jgi:hypothetical protein
VDSLRCQPDWLLFLGIPEFNPEYIDGKLENYTTTNNEQTTIHKNTALKATQVTARASLNSTDL